MSVIDTDYKVEIGGVDVTSRFDPFLTSISISRSSGEASDTCSINLLDSDRIVLPADRATVIVSIDGAQAFSGFVSDVSASISKGPGRTLRIGASSADRGSKVKEPVLRSMDEASFQDVAKAWGGKAGLTVNVSGSITSLNRPYWLMQNESFLSWGQRIAKEIGASFKVLGTQAYFVGINEGVSASGLPLTGVEAKVGDNLIRGEMTPIRSRGMYRDVEISYFDIAKGKNVKVSVSTGIDDVDVSLRTLLKASTKEQAEAKAKADGKSSDREKGGGSITILGAKYAEPEAICSISGWRPGIDGNYRISGVTHNYDKGSGFTTDLTLKQPQGSAGKDPR